MGLKVIGKGIGAIAAGLLAVSLMSSPATASTESPENDLQADYLSSAFSAPQGVDTLEWDTALAGAQEKYGNGDKAILEAQEAVGIAANYCRNAYYAAWRNNAGKYISLPADAGYGYNCILEVGAPGYVGVQALQRALNNCYGKNLATDGVFGNGTYNALLQVQSSLGLAADGVYGVNTRNAIRFSTTSGTACAYFSQRA